jgi:hypothetical protein
MKDVVLCVSAEDKLSRSEKPWFRTRIEIKKGEMPVLLWAEILDVLNDWKKYEMRDPNNRFEIYRSRGQQRARLRRIGSQSVKNARPESGG